METKTKYSKADQELIAEFMGLLGKDSCPIRNVERYIFKEAIHENEGNVAYELVYHKDWNWMMAVVQKIRRVTSWDRDRFGTQVILDGLTVKIKSGSYGGSIDEKRWFNRTFFGDTPLDSTFKAVVAYIHWYNKYQKQNA